MYRKITAYRLLLILAAGLFAGCSNSPQLPGEEGLPVQDHSTEAVSSPTNSDNDNLDNPVNIAVDEETVIEPVAVEPPVAAAGPDREISAGTLVTLQGGESLDPNQLPLQYHWQKISGPPVALIGSATEKLRFTAPDVMETTELIIELEVSNGLLTDRDQVVVTVIAAVISDTGETAELSPPQANAGVDQVVAEGTVVVLEGSPSSGSTSLVYEWSQINGPSVTIVQENQTEASFVAPDVDADVVLTFRLRVVMGNLMATDDVAVTVQNIPAAGSIIPSPGGGAVSPPGGSAPPPTGGDVDPAPTPEFVLMPSTAPGTMSWAQFPEFHLPAHFSIVYDGPIFDSVTVPAPPLVKGFSHLADGSDAQRWATTPQQRATLWSSVSGRDDAHGGEPPLRKYRVPWGNDLADWQDWWAAYLRHFTRWFTGVNPPANEPPPPPQVDILVSDVEAHYTSDGLILSTRNQLTSPFIPDDIEALPAAEYIDRYKRDMSAVHVLSHEYARSIGYTGRLGMYGEPPVRRDYGIATPDWATWTTDYSQLNYLLMDFTVAGPDWLTTFPGPVYDTYDTLFPSCYYFYGYPASRQADPNMWDTAGGYLAYLVFSIEINRYWSALANEGDSLEIIPFVWLRYHPSGIPGGEMISTHMAEATAIFAIMAGADGIWLYDGSTPDPTKNYAVYEYFTYGLYRLSPYSDLLTGDVEYYAPEDASSLQYNKKPVWRGVVNNGQMLVAVCNPYAAAGEVTVVPIHYFGTALGSVTLVGPETELVLYTLP
ncbi:MAG: hypothetical protein HJJLKODD_00787 [Phycisphaerae bacterium]|nr:hypothetical protein [Phycisphaerae bacterium]